MPEPKVYEFSKHVGALCVARDTNVFKLGAKLGVDPMELLRMINGRAAYQGCDRWPGEGTGIRCELPDEAGRRDKP
jgi:hypothetical protein